MENEDEQKHDTEEAGTSTNCDTNVYTSAQSEIQNRYVIRIYSRYVAKAILCHYVSLMY